MLSFIGKNLQRRKSHAEESRKNKELYMLQERFKRPEDDVSPTWFLSSIANNPGVNVIEVDV